MSCNETRKQPNIINEIPDIKIESLELDSVYCESIDASYVGSLHWYNDTLFYVDEKFCSVFAFNSDGTLVNRFLNQGSGPNEVATASIVGYCHLKDGGHLFLGPSNDCYIFNQKQEKTNFFVISKQSTKFDISYDSPNCYTLSYPNLLLRNHNDVIYSNVYCEHPQLHMLKSYDRYVENAHFLASIKMNGGLMDKVLGNYPVIYKNENTKQFSLVNFDIDEGGNFYVSFEADSLIYFYNDKFEPLYSFGYEGKDMDKSYSNLRSLRDFRNRHMEEREKYSYYTWIEYIDERKVLFRSYKKQFISDVDGLQIYQNNTLIGDVNVPKGFKVIGYSMPYFYGVVPIDEDNEIIKFYRFKI